MPSEVGIEGGVDYLGVLRFKGSTLIENQSEQEQFFKVVDDFIINEDVEELVNGIRRSINGQPARLQFYDDVRRLVPPRLQMEYNLLAPYTSSRVRTVRLLRGLGSPVSGSAIFGFSIRGGREHGTGFFVSEVGGEARAAGLRVGDQILRINGYSVEHAIHQEVIKLIQDSNHLNLKVRSVGMIPVKDTDDPREAGSEDGSVSSLNSTFVLPSEASYPLSPTKTKPKLIRKHTPPALTMTEIAALKKIDGHLENGEIRKPFQPQLETIPAGRESPPPVASDRRCDPLKWRPVSEEEDSVHRPSPSNTSRLDSPEQPEIIKLPSNCGEDEKQECILNIPRRSTLDCWSIVNSENVQLTDNHIICKGPNCHPGIFIQSTKEGGLARDFGLRPGDQIIECNGVNFEDIGFSDAVSILKKDKNLNLVIRKGAGADLFPGSSGYNSSASSVNGDGSTNGHSPNVGGQVCSNEEKERLTTVSEELSDITPESTLSNGIIKSPNRRVAVDKSKNWDDIDNEWEVADKQQSLTKNDDRGVYLTSCIQVSEESTIVSEEDSIKEVEVKTQQVVAMIHRTEVDDTDGTTYNKTEAVKVESQPCIPEAPSISTESHTSLSVTNASSSTGNTITSLSLSTALSQEIQKRAQRFGSIENDSSVEMLKKRNQSKEDVNGVRRDLLKEIADEKRMQHSRLMEEFKKAHSRMFANSVPFEEDETQPTIPEEEIKQRTLETEKQAESSERSQNNNQKDIKEKKEEEVPEAAAAVESPKPETKDEGDAATPPPPPPPPPMSSSKNEIANNQPQKEKERTAPSPPSTIQKQKTFTRVNSNDSISSLPPSFQKQTSYTRSLSSQSLTPKSPTMTFFGNENNIQIINSEKPSEVNPKPAKHHVSVTISEYPSSNIKKSEPSRIVYLPPNKPVAKKFGKSSSETNQKDWSNVTSQLQSELRQTLSRAKLKAEMENSSEDTKQTSKIFLSGSDGNNSKSNGTVEMELSSGKRNSLVSKLTKIYGPEKGAAEMSQNRNASNASYFNTDKILDSLANKVTIRVPNTNANAANKTSGNP